MKCCYIVGFLSSLWACESCSCWSHWSLIIKQTWCNNERAAENLVLNMWTQTPGRINEPCQRKHVPVEEPQHEEDPGGRDMKAGVRSDWTTGCLVIQWTRQLIGQRVPALDFLVLVFEAVEPVMPRETPPGTRTHESHYQPIRPASLYPSNSTNSWKQL